MNWKLLLSLSLLGLIMAAATVSLIPEKVEPAFWLVIFIFCAYRIARNSPGNYFLHGFVLSLLNSVWITAIHVIYYLPYLQNHIDMQPVHMHLPATMWMHPRRVMLIMGPIFGVIFGLIQGLFAFIASQFVKRIR